MVDDPLAVLAELTVVSVTKRHLASKEVGETSG
jgi:hypothetical protein